MNRKLALLAVAFLSISATSLRADLLGTSVSGSLTFSGGALNYFNPVYGFVPAGYGNSTGASNVVIGPGIEFGFKDFNNRDTANFTGTDLTVRDVCLADLHCGGSVPFQMKFTDLAFGSASLVTNDLGVTFSFLGDTLTVTHFGTPVPEDNASATFRFGSVATTPEPGTLALAATGVLGFAGAIRRRLAA